MNKKILIGAGVLAVAGIAYYMWKNKKESSEKLSINEEKASAIGKIGTVNNVDCPQGCVCSDGKSNCFTSNASGRGFYGKILKPNYSDSKLSNNPITTCIDRCQNQGKPRELCIWECSGGNSSTSAL